MAMSILPSAQYIITRQDALNLGLNKYFTGIPCASGHVDYRYLSRGCVACAAEQVIDRTDRRRELSREHRERHPEKEKARHALYSATNKEKISAKNAAWRKKNKEYAVSENARTASREWREANRERFAELVRTWQQNNPDKCRVHKQNRRARMKFNGGTLSSDIVQSLFEKQRGKCACCGKSLGKNFHLDHIIPLVLGGPNTDDNAQLLTQRCNMQKGAKHPIEFMQQKGYLL